MTLTEIVEEAYERVGKQLASGWQYRTARTSMNLLMLEWQTHGLNLWTVKNGTQALTAGTGSYTLAPEQLDIIEASIRKDTGTVNQSDLSIKRMSVSTFAQMTNKLVRGEPNMYYVQRAPTGITVHLWPVPDNSSDTLNYWYLERVEDASGLDGGTTMDVPPQILPALVAGLAYQLGLKDPNLSSLLPALKSEYDRVFMLAVDSMREKADYRIVPRIGRI